MQPHIIRTVKFRKDGRITIPKAIRDLFKTKGSLKFKIRLRPDHNIELVPASFDKRFFTAGFQKLLKKDAERKSTEKSQAENLQSKAPLPD